MKKLSNKLRRMSFTTYIHMYMYLSDNATETERQQINRRTENTKNQNNKRGNE